MARLFEIYHKEIKYNLQKKLEIKNIMEVPALEKIVINICVKDAINDGKTLKVAAKELTLIAGQKAVITKAKKSEATFKLRIGMPIGCKVTLRKTRMYEFLDRLINIALPRTRDFRGLSPKSFDKNGNYNFGIKEQIIFPEISYDMVDKIRGMNITINTTTNSDEHALATLKEFNLPIITKKKEKNG
jgi:large subunit ribosomal protein L5